ncbi:protein-glutamate methylesterase/protein-glutamine glutaminase [Acetobacter oeni]|uniref:Protein-glutamate methylesterase/protein-glutamine glutaminase n=1 Tax=Acetobacter oeni TaxID=304077 RepID=A0A511XLV2_9PROT|nr:chemotaxis response regulator protein-glutamate methylesterase [Acetobacter oeni]MBB3882973.1 two-component system chemotaxis response regulator CheB [Acetobacter oeni]NHO19051.1 chemotaxis-specific protein-glutamate methyltransferase CheB [Acetobacter oeni]GBR09227.1 chemotaxis protein CheB [Acetobacter oeni LMG 21952]GEN63908.1 chemotaxis response regulator protein-glutamate methylesterase of group 1 operon [Acetobacter oeni]
MNKKIRVLIVDDSKTGRAFIAAALERDPDIEILGTAGDPFEARDIIMRDQPDVITLDVEMPNMNGLQFLEKIMRLRPIPVVMVSGLTVRGADVAIEALQLGAFDCFPKASGVSGIDAYAGLIPIVKAAAVSGVARRPSLRPAMPRRDVPVRPIADGRADAVEIIAIGASTGGVEALGEILPSLPETIAPVVITQHMPALFTTSLAARLNRLCRIEVTEARDGIILQPGHAYIAPGGQHHLHVRQVAGRLMASLDAGEPISGHRPSVDELFSSVARAAGRRAVGVILTGMGRDGAAGLLAMREAGGRTIGQSEGTCVVYGMPRAAVELGAVEKTLSLGNIANALISFEMSETGVTH